MSSNILPVNCKRLQCFVELRYWSFADVKALLNWHVKHEHHFRRGWNNNMSLVNYEVAPLEGEATWSLMLYKLDYFKNSFAILIPFNFEQDSRGIPRAYTKFRMIQKQAVVWSIEENCYLQGSGRNALIETLLKRIVSGLGWDSAKCYKNQIRRYRLVELLNTPMLNLHSGLDVHHKDGIAKLLTNATFNIDDRSTNLEVIPRSLHSSLHASQGDLDFIEM
jgi:hypothetical protein